MSREMKKSGVDWIPVIPAHWEVKRNKGLFYEVNDRCADGSQHTLLSVSEYTGVSPRSAIIKDGEFETHAESLDGYKICKTGDIVMNIMLAWKRATATSNYDGIVSPAYSVYRGFHWVNTRYYHYLFRTDICADMFKRFSTGIIDSRLRLYPNVFLSLNSPVPPTEEQHRIVAFLDAQCARIDAVIEQTRASIEEYKKLKQSVITQAVTKGIRGNRPMKDSGIAWFRETPTDWAISRVGLHYDIILGKMLCSVQPSADYTLERYFCAANVHFDGISDVDTLKEMWFSTQEKKLYQVKNGDLLVVEGGAGAGGSAIVTGLNGAAFIQNSIMIVRGKITNDNRYLRYLIEYLVKQGYIEVACNKATIPHFTKDKLATVPYPVVPADEQKEIADYLDRKSLEIDRLLTSKQRFITELETYKKSLIYEYVTGKKEVPHGTVSQEKS